MTAPRAFLVARNDSTCLHSLRTSNPLPFLYFSLIPANSRHPRRINIVASNHSNPIGRCAHWLKSLGARQREVLERRFGLGGRAPETLEEVGKTFGVTRERARQLQQEALLRLRHIAMEEGWDSAPHLAG